MTVPPFDLSVQLSDLGDDLEHAVLDVLRSGQYIGGPVIQGFEKAFASFCSSEHAIGCNSGTDALVLALRGLGVAQAMRSSPPPLAFCHSRSHQCCWRQAGVCGC